LAKCEPSFINLYIISLDGVLPTRRWLLNPKPNPNDAIETLDLQ
jgi:hypothetical protein